MFRIRLVLLSALVVLLAGMVLSASASATTRWLVCEKIGEGKGKYKTHECKEEGGGKAWEKEPIVPGTEYSFDGEGGESKLETSALTIKCSQDETVAWHLQSLGHIEYEVGFVLCDVVGHSECSVSKDVFFLKGVLLGTNFEGPLELTLEPGSEFTISGSSCTLKGTTKLKGKLTCQIPNLTVMEVEHEIVCKPSGSEVEGESEGEKAKGIKFTNTEKVWLIGRDIWWGAE
jgi:hypothetical protein